MNSIAKEIARELRWVPKTKAYRAIVEGAEEHPLFVASDSARKARRAVFKLLNAGWRSRETQSRMFSVKHVKELDAWAQTAEQKCYTQSETWRA